jgi:hypothetical protein
MIIAVEKLRTMSPSDFAGLGLEDVAFVRPVVAEGQPAYAIHAADGRSMAVVTSREIAFAAIRQHDLEPLDVH